MIEYIFIVFLFIALVISIISIYKLKNKNEELVASNKEVTDENIRLESSCEKLIETNEKLQKNANELFEAAESRDKMIDSYEGFIQGFSDNLSAIDTQLTQLDNKGSFRADDEVGFVFTTIKLILDKLQEFNVNNAEKKEK